MLPSAILSFRTDWLKELENELRYGEKPSITYPPYNVIQHNTSLYEIQIAVAGFEKKDIKVKTEGDYLFITADKDTEEEKTYITKNIATRKFSLKWRLYYKDQVYRVRDVKLNETGLLTIHLEVDIPEEKREKILEIS